MPHTNWIGVSLCDSAIKEDAKNELIRFWNTFYTHISSVENLRGQAESTKSEEYKESLFNILKDAKDKLPLKEDELRKIQMKIEDLTTVFDEKSMFKTAPNLIKILIRDHSENAKDYLKARVSDKADMELLSEFGQYTLEALIVHVLCLLFSPQQD